MPDDPPGPSEALDAARYWTWPHGGSARFEQGKGNEVRAEAPAEVVTRPNEIAGHVFISYVRDDSKRVDQLQEVLQAAGVRVWRDRANLWPGEDWRLKIRSAITDNALVFIACFSQASLARRKSYQNEELKLAIEQMRLRRPDEPWLIPIRFDECEIPDWDIGGGRTLTSIQYADLSGVSTAVETQRLVETVLRILERRSGTDLSSEKVRRTVSRSYADTPPRTVSPAGWPDRWGSIHPQ